MDSEYAGLTYHEHAKLAVPGFAFQMNSYDLHAGQVLAPSTDVNCLTLMSAGEYAANVARSDYGMAQRRPFNWGRVGFVTAGMPASFTTGGASCRRAI